MKDIDKILLSILKQFLIGEIDFNELDNLWIESYIEETDDFFYEDLFYEISEFIYMGQREAPTLSEFKDGIIGQRELKTKIKNEISKYPELSLYL